MLCTMFWFLLMVCLPDKKKLFFCFCFLQAVPVWASTYMYVEIISYAKEEIFDLFQRIKNAKSYNWGRQRWMVHASYWNYLNILFNKSEGCSLRKTSDDSKIENEIHIFLPHNTSPWLLIYLKDSCYRLHLKHENIIHAHQFGFRLKHGSPEQYRRTSQQLF